MGRRPSPRSRAAAWPWGPQGASRRAARRTCAWPATWALLADSGTRWVRLWADWPTLMPAPGAFAADRVAALDDQLAQARADGLGTILTFYRTPEWVGNYDVQQLRKTKKINLQWIMELYKAHPYKKNSLTLN